MAFDSVPWFTGGGALHDSVDARLLAYAATSGAAGVVAPGDLAITQLPVAGTSVRAAVGGAVIPNLYPGGGQQSYVGRAASSTDIPVTATGSGSGRVDLVIARIDDPQYGGTVPADVTVGPYVKFAIIQNVAAGSTDIPAGLAYPAIALARLDIPASTATITTAMIHDLRKVVNAPVDPKLNVTIAGSYTGTTGAPSANLSFTFGVTFASPPVVTVCNGDSTAGPSDVVAVVYSATTTAGSAAHFGTGGVSRRVNWTATGDLA